MELKKREQELEKQKRLKELELMKREQELKELELKQQQQLMQQQRRQQPDPNEMSNSTALVQGYNFSGPDGGSHEPPFVASAPMGEDLVTVDALLMRPSHTELKSCFERLIKTCRQRSPGDDTGGYLAIFDIFK